MSQRLLGRIALGSAPATRPVVEPSTGQPWLELPLSTPADVADAARAARIAQRVWAARPVGERAAVILRFHDLVLARRDEGLDLLQRETGKARRDAMEEMLDVLVTARHYARDAGRLLRPRRHRGAFPLAVGVREHHQPRGLVGVIAPWNYPLTLAVSDAIPALLAGNAVLLKPDPQTSMIALWAVDLLIEAGLPSTCFMVVTGEGPEVGPAVIEASDYVMFTGSTRVGREVAAACGQRLIGCSLELGGKNAMIVRDDADIARGAEIAARASFANAGQLCISMERIYVDASIYEPFRAAFVARTRDLRLGALVGWGSDVGSLISAAQLARVKAHVDDARAKGATVLAGGSVRPDVGPYVFEPTILEGVTDDMVLCDEETFGPVVALRQTSGDEEAIALANDTPYGLNASVVTRDIRAAQRIAQRLRAGTVNINEGYAAAWGSTRAPMGGMGQSGLGRRHGDEGLLKYTEPQSIATQRMLGFGPQFGMGDQEWGELLLRGASLLKRMGVK